MTYKEKVIDLLKRMMADTKKKRDYLERYECSEDVKRLDGGLNFANNFLVALTSIKEDPVPEKIGNKPEGFVVEGKTITINKPPVDDQPQFNLGVDESNVFTEPAESEDERIRKWLLEYFYLHRDDLRGASVSDMDILNWLERQKEQKSVDTEYISGIRKELLGIEDNAKGIDGLTESQWVAIRAAHRLLGEYVEKEQKPVEWHPEDEQNLNVCLSYVKDEPLRSWLIDAIHVRYDKPAWSEEDEKNLERAIQQMDLLEEYIDDGSFATEVAKQSSLEVCRSVRIGSNPAFPLSNPARSRWTYFYLQLKTSTTPPVSIRFHPSTTTSKSYANETLHQTVEHRRYDCQERRTRGRTTPEGNNRETIQEDGGVFPGCHFHFRSGATEATAGDGAEIQNEII